MTALKTLRRILGIDPEDDPQAALPPDPLRDLVEHAHAQTADAWQAVNENRRRRGERPITPDERWRPSNLIDPRERGHP